MILRFRTVFGFLALLSLFSCGGEGGSLTRDDGSGSGNTGGGGTTTVTRNISLVFTDADGQPSTALTGSTPLILNATAIDSNGDPVTNTLITYTFQPAGLAIFGNDAGTASTDASGVATLQILVGENSGAGEIRATLSSGETAITTFNSEGAISIENDNVTRSIQLVLTDKPTGEVSAELSQATPLILTANAIDSNDNPVTAELITYTFQPEGLAVFGNDSGTGRTGIDGKTTIDILVAENSGAGQIIATLGSGETATITFNSAGTAGDDTVTRNIDLVFINSLTGSVADELSESTPLTLTATAIDSNGAPVTNTLITYTLQPQGLAIFGNDSGTASTDASGVATIDILVGENSGAGEILATLSSGETAITTFNSAGTILIGKQPASLDLFGSSTQLASSGSDNIELIALVKDVNNVLLEGINVTFSANAEASLQLENGGSVAVTGVDGIAKATLSTQNNQEKRIIEVTASTATFSQVLEVQVAGTQININGSSSAILNAPVPLTISLVDSDGNGIANETVSLSANNGQLSDSSPVTSAEGQITVNYTGNVAGSDKVIAIALGVQSEFPIVVQEDNFSFVDASVDSETVEIELNTPTELTVKWLRNGNAFANGTVTLTTSRGQVAVTTAITDTNGNVTYSIESNNAGFASITATGVDAQGNEVSARTLVEFYATVAGNIIVDGTPDSLAPSGQTSTITAVVRDPNGNLVKGKVINFMVDDVSGGSISPNQATTNRSGIASTVYTSNAVSSFEAVKVYATVADTPNVSNFTSLTVGNRAFDISIGTGNLIEAPEQSSYSKEFSVFVTDANSNPVPNAIMTFSAPPVKFTDGGKYRKGSWFYDEVNSIWLQVITVVCDNEDVDGDGILDVGEDANNNGIFDEGEDINDDGIFDEGEDINKDGLLTPGNVVSIPSTRTTDDNGQALINILYAKQFGAWVDVDISVKAESAGSESSESQEFSLEVLAADLVNIATPPPSSPYGQSSNCNDID